VGDPPFAFGHEKYCRGFSGKAIQVFQMSLDGNEVEEICCELSLSKDSVYTLKNRVKKYLIREIKKLREELEL
jgi:RNA polymerase sigma-70 factor (ECF subfamily)